MPNEKLNLPSGNVAPRGDRELFSVGSGATQRLSDLSEDWGDFARFHHGRCSHCFVQRNHMVPIQGTEAF